MIKVGERSTHRQHSCNVPGTISFDTAKKHHLQADHWGCEHKVNASEHAADKTSKHWMDFALGKKTIPEI